MSLRLCHIGSLAVGFLVSSLEGTAEAARTVAGCARSIPAESNAAREARQRVCVAIQVAVATQNRLQLRQRFRVAGLHHRPEVHGLSADQQGKGLLTQDPLEVQNSK
jgi:hypothetical protein